MPVDIKKLLTAPTPDALREAVPIYPMPTETWKNIEDGYAKTLAASQGFKGEPGQLLIDTDPQSGKPTKIYIGVKDLEALDDMWTFSRAAEKLPEGAYRIAGLSDPEQARKASVGWALARYKYKIRDGALESDPGPGPRLVIPGAAANKINEIETEIKATWQVRDLINMPANILNTVALGREVKSLAKEFNAQAKMVLGRELEQSFPLIHAVGKASVNAPRLVHFSWQGSDADEDTPTVLLVGKGIVFDNGGVQVKPGTSMETMKKDMGGSATALGLARMIMGNDLPVKLRVVIPIAENAISGNAYRPSDIIKAHDGTEVEIGHTDAEGRLILADALAFGVEQANPDLIIDYATLTGAQRVADGYEVSGVFSNKKEEGRKIEDIGEANSDDLQLHHLFEKYRPYLKSDNGGEISSKGNPGPGATMAAMFLQHFIRAAKKDVTWFHFDMNGANTASRPGRPKGGEAMGMRAAYHYLKKELGL